MRRLRSIVLVAVLALAVGACGSDDKSDGSASTTEATSGAAPSATVSLKDLKFAPEKVTVEAGDAVEWKWDENVLHNVSGDGFKSDNKSDGTYVHTFTKAGTYDYQCTLHAGMTGTVEVN